MSKREDPYDDPITALQKGIMDNYETNLNGDRNIIPAIACGCLIVGLAIVPLLIGLMIFICK